MNDYIFIFGRDSDLSLLEVISYFNARKINFKFKRLDNTVCVFSLLDMDFNKVIKDLGGTIKIGKIIDNIDDVELFNKIKYGISVYKGNDKDLREQLKSRFKESRIKATYKPSSRKEKALMPSESLKLDLEFIVYDKITAVSIAVYNPLEYEKRDLNRPEQRPIHQISLRLAKILINMSGVKESQLLLDPFCGVGTILQEALLMNINVIGIDKSEDMIKSATKNLKWLNKGNWELINEDSAKAKLNKKVDVIVTEPYLGPFLKEEVANYERIKGVIENLEDLYFRVLHNLMKYIKDDSRIVFIAPSFRTNKGKKTLNFTEIINRLGLEVNKNSNNIRIPLEYNAPDSRIERLIYVLNKKQ